MGRKGKDGLSSRVLNFKPLRDDMGRYIPYCDFGPHQGISLRPSVCEQRACEHYRRLYLNGEGRIEEPNLTISKWKGENCYGKTCG